MEITKVQCISKDLDYYTKAFQVYSDRLGKFRVRCSWVDREFPAAVVDRLAHSFPQDTTIRMLGVGSGSGEMDSKMATSIKSRFKAVHNTVLEPANKQLEMYRTLIDNHRDDQSFDDIEFDLRQETMDGYRAKLNEVGGKHPKYHFISAIHSLYYVDHYKEIIYYLYDKLVEGGILLVTIVGEESGFWRLWSLLSRFEHVQDDIHTFLCTRHVSDALDDFSIPHERLNQSSRVVITDCFDPESEEGRLLVDFLSHTLDLRGTAPPEVQKRILDYLGSEKCSERRDDGAVLFNNDWDALVSQKPRLSSS